MPDYNPGPAIIEASFAELQKIVSWINNPGEDPARTKTVQAGSQPLKCGKIPSNCRDSL